MILQLAQTFLRQAQNERVAHSVCGELVEPQDERVLDFVRGEPVEPQDASTVLAS
jgi:hypothetical protein